MAKGTESAALAEAETWGFAHADGGLTWHRDHLALIDADHTFCGVSKNPHGHPLSQPFDPDANYACRRCVRSLRRRGPVRVYWRSGVFRESLSAVVEAISGTE